METVYTTHPSPLGELLLVGDGSALSALTLPGQQGRGAVHVQPEWRRRDSAYPGARAQLDAYFAGDLKEFRLELRTHASEFTERVWAAIDDIPFGATDTYGAVATRMGASRAAVRAVGRAVGANPLLIVRPCHRVIGADGTLTGYAGGLESKRQLLSLEGASWTEG